MNDQHITALATIVQDFLLLSSAILIAWYLCETRKMRKAAEAQVEAAFRPALIVWHGGSLEESPRKRAALQRNESERFPSSAALTGSVSAKAGRSQSGRERWSPSRRVPTTKKPPHRKVLDVWGTGLHPLTRERSYYIVRSFYDTFSPLSHYSSDRDPSRNLECRG